MRLFQFEVPGFANTNLSLSVSGHMEWWGNRYEAELTTPEGVYRYDVPRKIAAQFLAERRRYNAALAGAI